MAGQNKFTEEGEGRRSADILLQRLQEFEGLLKSNQAQPDKEAVAALVSFLERKSQTPDRYIEVYADPKLKTYCCAMVPAKKVLPDGEIVEEKQKKTFLIGVPASHLLGLAPRAFLLGEILHERGHALFTSFKALEKLQTIAAAEGYDGKILFDLTNVVEDPRMERLVGGKMHVPERKMLFEKNSRWIVPNIAGSLSKITPVEQFLMLIKLERLWEIHRQDWPDLGIDPNDKPWKLEEMNEDVQRLFLANEAVISRITGSSELPALKTHKEVEKLVLTHLWPALKELIDKYPKQEGEGESEEGEEGGEGEGQEGQEGQEGEEGKKGKKGKQKGGKKEPARSGQMPGEDEHYDPTDPSTWPDDLKQVLQKMIDKHEQRLQQDSEENKRKQEIDQERQAKNEAAKNALKQKRDGIGSPEARKQYEQFVRELQLQIIQIKRVFNRYLPSVAEPEYEYGKRGSTFSTPEYVRRYGSGFEKPLRYKADLEKKGLILQILVDVSGSMQQGERIVNAVKACLAVLEAAKGTNVEVEILANDQGNLEDSPEYIIKAFNEQYGGGVKERLVDMITRFGGENEDARAILAALPRMQKKVRQARSEYDRSAGLMVYISDSTTQSEETRQATATARIKVPLEGTAISNEADIAEKVRFHFGEKSVIPPDVKHFPQAFQTIIERYIRNLRTKDHG